MRRNNKQVTFYFVLFSLLLIGVVYAILQANLQINGTAKIKANTWDIHFDNIQVNENSVSIGTGDSAATIDPNDNCKVDFEVTLSLPGDFYEFTIDVVNAGTIDGMIGELNKTLKVNNEVVQETPDYLNYSVTYADGMEILENHKIEAGATETYLVRLEFKTDIEELPEATTIATSLTPQYIQADSSAVPKPNLFVDGTWDQIVAAYKSGNITSLQQSMEDGATRDVDLGTFGIHKVRIGNLSKPEVCSTEGFSQTACGFVIEFADIISTHRINQGAYDITGNGYGNEGGWEYSDIRAYLNSGKYLEGQTSGIDYTNGGIFNAIPEALRNSIINTVVVSGHGEKVGETNFVTTDKLYLLSYVEIYGSNFVYDSVGLSKTRQFDYYASIPVTSSSYSGAIKKYNNSATYWWMRCPYLYDDDYFWRVNQDGYRNDFDVIVNSGVSPAFRIAA